MSKSVLNNSSKEVMERNFLEQNPDIPLEQKVVIASDIPKTQKIVFSNLRDPGVTLHFHYASKTHPLRMYDLAHGHEYELPIEVIDHLEGQRKSDPYACHTRTYGKRTRVDGITENFVNGYSPCFQCKYVRY